MARLIHQPVNHQWAIGIDGLLVPAVGTRPRYYVVFSPLFGFEVFFLVAASITYVVYFQRSSVGWTFYWNRLQGTVRWFLNLDRGWWVEVPQKTWELQITFKKQNYIFESYILGFPVGFFRCVDNICQEIDNWQMSNVAVAMVLGPKTSFDLQPGLAKQHAGCQEMASELRLIPPKKDLLRPMVLKWHPNFVASPHV